VTEQGYPPRRTGQAGRGDEPRYPQDGGRVGWQTLDAFEEDGRDERDLPPWAVPGGIRPVRAPRRPNRVYDPADDRERVYDLADDLVPDPGEPGEPGPPEPDQDRPAMRGRIAGRSRAAAARRRRSKRRLVGWAGAAIVVVVLVTAGYLVTRSPAPKPRYVTTWQRGDIRSVPDTCRIVGSSALRQYLAGTPARIQPYSQASQSQCTYTVDQKPVFRVLNITAQAYPPNLTVTTGNGSATATATYTFAQQRELLAHPPKNTPQPPATIGHVGGLGDEALSAVQVFHVKAVIDRVTVIARYHNVLITVYLSGQASDGFGPVPAAGLRTWALAVTRDVLAQIKREPTVS